MKIRWKTIEAVTLGVLVLIQFVPVRRDNPPVTSDVQAPGDVKAILERCCYDCHSHRTHWPWYSRIAPVSWLVASDVRQGRASMDLSQWDDYPASARAYLKTDVHKQVSEGDMPPFVYLLAHRAARVKPADLNVLKQWAGGQAAAESADKPRGAGGGM